MMAVILEIYEGGKDLIPGWDLKEQAEGALATGGIEGLRRYYDAYLARRDHQITRQRRPSNAIDERLWNRSASASCRSTWEPPDD